MVIFNAMIIIRTKFVIIIAIVIFTINITIIITIIITIVVTIIITIIIIIIIIIGYMAIKFTKVIIMIIFVIHTRPLSGIDDIVAYGIC
jgi:hypothetical protein